MFYFSCIFFYLLGWFMNKIKIGDMEVCPKWLNLFSSVYIGKRLIPLKPSKSPSKTKWLQESEGFFHLDTGKCMNARDPFGEALPDGFPFAGKKTREFYNKFNSTNFRLRRWEGMSLCHLTTILKTFQSKGLFRDFFSPGSFPIEMTACFL